ncbi:ATP-binding protein [Paenibacillus sp. 2TAB19]
MEQEVQEAERKERRARLEKNYKHSIMSERLKRVSFDSFQLRRGTEAVYYEAKRFAEEFESVTCGLMIYGGVGNGKSHLAAAIHHEVEKKGYVSLFLDVSQLFNIAKDTFKNSSKITLTDIINAAVDCDLLTLDEIGSGVLTETEYNDILFPIINGREGKKTNYTSNLNLNQLRNWFAKGRNNEPLDTAGRLIDRILGSCNIHENIATSKRQEDAMKRMEDTA